MVRKFALDQGFPLPIVRCMEEYIRSKKVELFHLYAINKELGKLDDWQLLLSLKRLGFDGLVTQDSQMLNQAQEMCVLRQIRLSLIVTKASGQDPIKATGLLLSHLKHIANDTSGRKAQIWVIGATRKEPISPHSHIDEIASRAGVSAATLIRSHSLSKVQLSQNPVVDS